MRMIQAAVEINARELKSHIEELYWGAQKKVVLLGHSKGGLDAAAACSMFWEDLKDKVVGLAVLQCPYGGSPIAADILREGQIADTGTRRLMEVLICKLIKVVQAWWGQLLFFAAGFCWFQCLLCLFFAILYESSQASSADAHKYVSDN